MRGISAYLVGAALMTLLGALCLVGGLFERGIADAERSLVTLGYDESKTALDGAERYLAYGRAVPWIGARSLNGIRARQAALRYWQGQYDAVVPSQTDAMAALDVDNVELQFVVANATYRVAQSKAADRASSLRALDAGAQAYLTVLKRVKQDEDVAFNYEYVVRLREEIEKGRRPPSLPLNDTGIFGRQGAPPRADPKAGNFKIYIPLESEEQVKGALAGKAAATRRKG